MKQGLYVYVCVCGKSEGESLKDVSRLFQGKTNCLVFDALSRYQSKIQCTVYFQIALR